MYLLVAWSICFKLEEIAACLTGMRDTNKCPGHGQFIEKYFVVIMKNIIAFLGQINWGIVILLCATLGLAPFSPPHVIEKLSLLTEGRLIKPIDWFDLLLHGFPWILLILKVLARLMKKE